MPNGGEEEGGKPLFCLCSSSNVSSHPFFSIATLFYTCTYFSRAIGTSYNFPCKVNFFVAAASAFAFCVLVLWGGRALSVTPRVSSPTTAGTGLASVFSHSVGFLRRRGSAGLFRDNAWSLLGSEELPAAELVRTQPTTLLCSNTDSPRDPETAILYALCKSAKDCLLSGQEKACSRITRLAVWVFVRWSPCRTMNIEHGC